MTIHKKPSVFKQKKPKVSQSQLSHATERTLKNLKQVINKKKIEELAYESKLIQRVSSKIMGFDFLTTMLVASLDGENSTLEKICDIFHSLNRHISIKPQSIMERLNDEAAPRFFKKIFKEILKVQLDNFSLKVPPDLLVQFTKILIQDSSSIDLNAKLSKFFKGSGGRASKASAKIDVIYDFKSKRYEQIKLTDHSEADQKLGLSILDYLVPDALIIRDLGYLRMDCILKIDAMKAFFLSRFKNNTLVYLNKDDPAELDLADYIYRNCRGKNVIELKAFITVSRVPMRIIAYLVPEDIAAERRRKAHATAKKQGRTLTKKSLALLDYSIFITNVTKEVWPAEVVGTIYRLRWQIELLFKSWKSNLKVDYLKGINEHRIESLLYIKMITIIIINEIYKLMDYIGNCIGKDISMFKVYSWIRFGDRLLRILNGKLNWWEERHLDDMVSYCMSKQKRKDRKTTLQSIYEQDYYYQKAG